jgi:hypothetical protein
MSRVAAKAIVQMMIRHLDEHGELLRTIQPMCTSEEFIEYRIAIAQCSGTIVSEVTIPIVTRYPELHPPGDDEEPDSSDRLASSVAPSINRASVDLQPI